MIDKTKIRVDIVIFGGGIAGLWALNRLRNLGYNALLLESHTLGGGQTIKSQGIIHGGIKYALKGFLTSSANSIETMPKRWQDCLQGKGELDLRAVKILSQYQLLWSTGSLSSEMTNFFASKALHSRVQKLERTEYPPVLHNPAFKGHVYRLDEVVLDMPSLIATLIAPFKNQIFKINPNLGYEFIFDADNPLNIRDLNLYSENIEHSPKKIAVTLQARRYIFAAGEGNASLTNTLTSPPAMQRRPLQMVMVKFDSTQSDVYALYGHCMDSGMNPRITITTHPAEDGKTVWYIGGQIAEEGAHRTPDEQIVTAEKELNTLFPWLNFSQAQFSSFFINRAEHQQPGGKRPDNPFLETIGNVMVTWPTKLALAPLLSDDIIVELQRQGIQPSPESTINVEAFKGLGKPDIAKPVWDEI